MNINYKLATEKACIFLLRENFNDFPLNLKEYVKNKYRLVTFTKIAKALNISYLKLKSLLKDSWGTVAYDGINYTIMYDDMLDKGAQLFTIAHEIGHIELGHLTSPELRDATIYIKGNHIHDTNRDLYKKIENEANCFARNILCPVSIIEDMLTYELMCPFISDLYTEFGITQKAYETRMSEYIYSEDIKNITDDTHNYIIKKFYGFIRRMQNMADSEYEEYITKQIESGEFYATSSTIY